MTESDYENDLTDEQLLKQLTFVISKFLNLSKEINSSQLEAVGKQKIAEFGGFWRGSDIQVVKSEIGEREDRGWAVHIGNLSNGKSKPGKSVSWRESQIAEP